MKNLSKIFKALFFVALFLSAEARIPFNFRKNTKAHQTSAGEVVSNTQLGLDMLSNILTGIGELSDSKLFKALGAFGAALGPGLSILNIFLGDPTEQKLDQINSKLDQVIATMDHKFERVETLIEKTDCLRALKETLSTIRSYSSKMRTNMKIAILHGGGPAQIRSFFLNKMKQENNVINLRKAMDQLIDSLTSSGGSLDQCDIINLLAKGTTESSNLAGSSSALLRLSIKMFQELNFGVAYLVSYAVSKSIEGENIATTQKVITDDYDPKIEAAAKRYMTISQALDDPKVFAKNAKENLKRIWDEVRGKYSTGDWNGYDLSQTIYIRFKSAFPEKNLAVFTYSDYKEDNYFKSIRKYDASFRTKDLTPSYDKNYVIEVAFTNYVKQDEDVANYHKDDYCLNEAHNIVWGFRQRTDNAANFITQSLFDQINSICAGRLGGLTFVWEPPKGSSVLSTSYYQATHDYTGSYRQCKWNDSKWCAMDGRMYHLLNMPEKDGWRWRAYIWTTI